MKPAGMFLRSDSQFNVIFFFVKGAGLLRKQGLTCVDLIPRFRVLCKTPFSYLKHNKLEISYSLSDCHVFRCLW